MTALDKDEEWLEAVACGVILRRDGRLQRTARLGGPDVKTAPPAELVGMWDRINDSLRARGPGWLVLIQTGRDVTRVVGPLAVSNAIRRHCEAAYYLTFELRCGTMKMRSRDARILGSQIQVESAKTNGHVNIFIERTDRVLQLIESIVPAARWLSEEDAMTYTQARMARERTGVRCAFEIVLNLWIVFSACALLPFSAEGMV
jgi:type IV secretion system protein TrbE